MELLRFKKMLTRRILDYKLRLSRQTWLIIFVMVTIMVIWKSRSNPTKAVNYKSKQRQEIPAPQKVKHIKDGLSKELALEGTTMEDELSSEDISEMELLPTVDVQKNDKSRTDEDTFSTPTAYDINKDMPSSEDDSKGKYGKDALLKHVQGISDEDVDENSTPSTFDADPFSENMLSSEDSDGKDKVNALSKHNLLNNEDSKGKDGKHISVDDTYSTPSTFDINPSTGNTLLIKESKEEDENNEPTQQAQENGNEDVPSRDDSERGDENTPSQHVQENGEEVMVSEDSKDEDEKEVTQQQAGENNQDADEDTLSKQVQEVDEEVIVSEDSKDDNEEVNQQQTQENNKESDGDAPSQSEDTKGEDEDDIPQQQDKGTGGEVVMSNNDSKGEVKEDVLLQQVQESGEDAMASEDPEEKDEEDSAPQQAQEKGEKIVSISQSSGSSPTCSPVHHIMFLKTHKCASSTIQNILLRYGYQNDLFFALSAGHYFGHPKKFKYSMMSLNLLPDSGKADILTLHSRLNIPEHQKAMHPDAKWITIVRDPVEQFESLYNYYELKDFYKKDLASFLKQPVEVLRKVPRWNGKHGRNTMLFDMGYPDTVSPEELKEVITTMDNLFHYVMVSDRMDESLILLRNELCWTNHDIIGFTKNARIKENKTLSIELTDKISQMNMEDTAIYDHFLNKHLKSVEAYGIDKMAEEVSELEKLRAEYYDFCVAEEVLGHDKRLKGNQEWKASANAYLPNNNNSTCIQIIWKETKFVDFVRNHQKDLIKKLTKIKK